MLQPIWDKWRVLFKTHVLDELRKLPQPDNYLPWHISALVALSVALMAYWQSGQIAFPLVAGGIVIIGGAGWFSWRRRFKQSLRLKIIIAVLMIVGFVILGTLSLIAVHDKNVSQSLLLTALLILWVLTLQIVTMVRIREVSFCIVGSGILLVIAGADSYGYSFIAYVLIWGLVVMTGIWLLWAGQHGVHFYYFSRVAVILFITLVIAIAAIAIVPPPESLHAAIFPSSATGSTATGVGNHILGGTNSAAQTNTYQIGGYNGFSRQLNTALRGSLSDQVVYRVRATQPTYWVNTTYNKWTGQSWYNTLKTTSSERIITSPSDEFTLSTALPEGTQDVQTFYPAVVASNVILHAYPAFQLYFPAHKVYINNNTSTVLTGITLQKGSIYTVISYIPDTTEAILHRLGIAAGYNDALTTAKINTSLYLQLPPKSTLSRVDALAHRIVRGSRGNVYIEIQDIMHWMHTHVHYSQDIPSLRPGQDAVNAFLLGSRVGFCEQISTSMVVMLRLLGVPAREATGYIPGSYNVITGMYSIEAKDAHAWTQVWFPGYGWLNFDPTANVPLANPTVGQVLLHYLQDILNAWPILFILFIGLIIGYAAAKLSYRYLHRPRGWAQILTYRIETVGRKMGISRLSSQSFLEYAHTLQNHFSPADNDQLISIVMLVYDYEYGHIEPTATAITQAMRWTKQWDGDHHAQPHHKRLTLESKL